MDKNAFKWPITIYYEDTDAGGVVYHSNYLKFFERARTELLRSHGVFQHVLLEKSVGFVVKNVNIDFMQAARLDEQLIVETLITEIKKVSLTFCQLLVNSEGKVLCKATVKVACIDNAKMKPTAIPLFILSEISCDR
jgi:acyl-CoA thioester hydrolase